MYLFGFTINTLRCWRWCWRSAWSDDAIVMLETSSAHRGGDAPFSGAQGQQEIGFAIIAMTLTLAAVYVPLASRPGRTGRLFIEFALTLDGSVVVSASPRCRFSR